MNLVVTARTGISARESQAAVGDLHIAQLFPLRQTLLELRAWHAADGTGKLPPANLNPRRLVKFAGM